MKFLISLNLIGAIFIAAGAYLFIQQINFNYHALTTTGIVIKPLSRPTIEFISQDNKVIHFSAHTVNHPPPYARGTQLEVLYSADDPQKAYINSFSDLWFIPIGVVFSGLLFIVPCGYFLISTVRYDRKQKSFEANKKTIMATYQKTVRVKDTAGQFRYQLYSYWLDPERPKDMYIYKSDFLTEDPYPLLEKNNIKEIKVIVDAKDYTSYKMELNLAPYKN